MITIILEPLFHRGEERIALIFSVSKKLYDAIKRVQDMRWSSSHRRWHMPCTREACESLALYVQDLAVLDVSSVKTYLQQKNTLLPPPSPKVHYTQAKMMLMYPLSEVNLEALKQFRDLLVLKGYSENTIRNYINEFHHLLRLLGKQPVYELEKQHILSYLLWLLEKQGYSETHVHTTVNAVKFYFEKVLKREAEFYDLPRPKKPFKLPSVLAESEVLEMILRIDNLKHRCMLMAGYSAGLRVSEIVALKLRDIDSKRMMIHIRNAKGKKDRMVPLSQVFLDNLRAYYKIYTPKEYIFEGQHGGKYSMRSVQKIVQQAKVKSGIWKTGGTHMLRHSYATHLLETGTDIRIIQELLGHNSITTTMRYTHVSKKDIGRIESPLDKLNWKELPNK
jgi:integrase/recombinase XerD